MVIEKNDCVGCAIPCIDCGRKRTPHLCCDACGDTVESLNVLQYYEEYQLCDECLEELGDILPPPMLRIEAGASRSSIPMNTVSAS